MSPPWLQRIAALGADVEATLDAWRALEEGKAIAPRAEVSDLPAVDGVEVVDVRTARDEDRRLGWQALSRTALGILNGGGATSYFDKKKNFAIHPTLAELYRARLERVASHYAGLPKALAPAFYQPDGEPGPSFWELKVRHLVLLGLALGQTPELFQMTSPATHPAMEEAWAKVKDSPWVGGLLGAGGGHLPRLSSRQQELIPAFTRLEPGGPYEPFLVGERPLLLPGGHGHNFRVLAPIYRRLASQGWEWAYLTNVDNLGALPSVVGLGLAIRAGAEAAFDFSYRTPVDVKGGILYRDPEGRLQCGDLGVAVDQGVLDRFPNRPVLFNCATGLFYLPSLVDKLEDIGRRLPHRSSVQDKDVGRYIQVERITWEVIGLLRRPLILAVEKSRRFLAAKMVFETFLTSGLDLDRPEFQTPELQPLRHLGEELSWGLSELLRGPYGLVFRAGRWEPMSLEEVRARLEQEGPGWLLPF